MVHTEDNQTAAIAIFLLLITIIFTAIVMRNFGRGLKESSKTRLSFFLSQATNLSAKSKETRHTPAETDPNKSMAGV